MNDFQMIQVQGELAYTFDFTDALPSTSPATTVSSVALTAQTGLTLGTPSADYANARVTVIVSGATHAQQYWVQAIATLSNGEKIPKDLTLLGFNA